MLDEKQLLERLHRLSPSEVTELIRRALIASNIPYTTDGSGIGLETLLPSKNGILTTEKNANNNKPDDE